MEDNWQRKKEKVNRFDDDNPTNYEFRDQVYRKGAMGGHNYDSTGERTIYLDPDMYFFYMPQVNSRDFEHLCPYHLEVNYGEKHIRTFWFVAIDPFVF